MLSHTWDKILTRSRVTRYPHNQIIVHGSRFDCNLLNFFSTPLLIIVSNFLTN